MVRLFNLPVDASEAFQEAHLNPASISFIAKFKNPADGQLYPIVYLNSGMKIVISDEMFTDLINSCDIIKPEVPDAFHRAWANLDDDE